MYRILELCRFFIAQRTSLKIPILYFDIQICFFYRLRTFKIKSKRQRGKLMKSDQFWKHHKYQSVSKMMPRKSLLQSRYVCLCFFHFQLLCQLSNHQNQVQGLLGWISTQIIGDQADSEITQFSLGNYVRIVET